MESIVWTVDWNPEMPDAEAIKREVTRSLKDQRVVGTIKRLAEQAVREAVDDGLETEHLVWLDTRGKYAFFVRVWYETSEQKVFIIVEENDAGDVGFLIMDDFDCATYGSAPSMSVEFRDPESLGIDP